MKDELIQQFMDEKHLSSSFFEVALKWYIPTAKRIYEHQIEAREPLFIGVNGCQGSGKSTFSAFVEYYLRRIHNVSVVTLSLDDFYLTQAERQGLASDVHPLFSTRGVPGTHNMKQMSELLHKLKTRQTGFRIPRFNKAIDDPFPEQQWPLIESPIDVVLIEGWCWGTRPQSAYQLSEPINELERVEDSDGRWRQYVDTQLEQYFLPLYNFIDYWILLKAPSFDCVFQWRREQEQKLAKFEQGDKSGVMDDEQLKRFISHYQRLTEHTLHNDRAFDLVFELDDSRQIKSVITRQESA